MAQTKNLCAQVPIDLHQKISEAREQAGLTTAQYITALITEYFKKKESRIGHHRKQEKSLENIVFSRLCGGDGGIRTHVPLRTT